MPIQYRPWGFYRILDEGQNFLVKMLEVFPGERTSLQYHNYRNEFWYVVEGEADVQLDGEATILSVRDSLFIPIGTTHRITNNSKSPLKIIEIQTGPGPFQEDDIIRIQDDYSRA